MDKNYDVITSISKCLYRDPLSAKDVYIRHDSAPLGTGHFYPRNQRRIYALYIYYLQNHGDLFEEPKMYI